MKKIKNLLEINLVKCSSKFLAHIKKHLSHTGTLTNIQSNSIKLSGVVVDITKLFLHRKITRNISCQENIFNTKTLAEVVRTNLTHFFHYLYRFISG